MRKATLRVSMAGLMVLGTVGASAGVVASSAAAASGPSITTVIPNLNTPRGITFDGRGSLYVAESGVAGAGAAGLTTSGRVSKYARGSTTPSWSTSFESLYATQDPTQPPDVLGPEGMSALANSCRKGDDGKGDNNSGDDHSSSGGGCQVRMIMSESHDGVAAVSNGALNPTQLGHLFALDSRTGQATSLSDVGDQMFTFTGIHKDLFPSDFPDSNPYGVLITKDKSSHRVRTFVADAGANTILEINADGSTRVIAFIPNETAAPFRDATPTCIAQGPDGMLYVATLNFVANLFVYGSGKSNVWRVDPNANFPTAPTLWATGLTTATSCTFDRHGNFWAAEMFQPNASGAPGDVVRIPFNHPTHLDRIGGGQLPLPGGIAQGPDGAMYVTINSSSPVAGSGAVVRISTHGHEQDD
jgi:hypothetical protein